MPETPVDAVGVLDRLASGVPGVEAIVLADRSGRPLASSTGTAAGDADRLAAVAGGVSGLAGAAMALLNTGVLEQAAIDLGHGHLVVHALGGGRRIVALTSPDGDLSALEREVRDASSEFSLVQQPQRAAGGGEEEADPLAQVHRLTERFPGWRIRYEVPAPAAAGGFTAERDHSSEDLFVLLGLLNAVHARTGAELEARLAIQDAVSTGLDAITSLSPASWNSIERGLAALLRDPRF
ncbi:roadblock/LC7 domain-containing protein [Actinorugispora endophytica]|uniref:Putative regulator of Ras-like GTPase activity (Roadblock/LC7/MglB family) n=1 Tax=Actinorugispora endophytica TaxID=1605990 RepID=A0A4V3D7Q5_9ACTN|nr:roadblock/LC7 domain-containing protein [Actinorugispora endophytica]TDQ48787.1 putative regulator of Ras-like GTPase activity (Roadblock/LC7/MglB family) [Actinorugispora endophytica]